MSLPSSFIKEQIHSETLGKHRTGAACCSPPAQDDNKPGLFNGRQDEKSDEKMNVGRENWNQTKVSLFSEGNVTLDFRLPFLYLRTTQLWGVGLVQWAERFIHMSLSMSWQTAPYVHPRGGKAGGTICSFLMPVPRLNKCVKKRKKKNASGVKLWAKSHVQVIHWSYSHLIRILVEY